MRSSRKTVHRRAQRNGQQRAEGNAVPAQDVTGGRVVYLEIRHLLTDYICIRAADPAAEEKLLASIARHGQKVPILVARAGRGRRQVLDGFRRLRALCQLERETVAAVEWPGDVADGLVEARRLRGASSSGPLEEGWLVEVLVDAHGMSLSAIGLRLGKTTSWVSRRLGIVRQLPDGVRDKVLAGALSGYVAAKCAVPLARAKGALVGPFCDSVIAHALSTRQAEVVYQSLIRTVDPQIQKDILERPQRVLEPVGASSKPGDARKQSVAVADRVEKWCRHTVSVHGLMSQLLVTGVSEDTLEQLAVIWKEYHELVEGTLRQFDNLARLATGGASPAEDEPPLPLREGPDVHS